MSALWQRGVLRVRGHAPPAEPLVVKLGGSLLERAGWGRAVAELLDSLPAPRLLVVGGGPLVDALRALDRTAPQPADLLHRLAIDCMGLTARLVAEKLGAPLVAEPAADTQATAVLDAPRWLSRDGRLDRLPVGWHVTSDSIAAAVAAVHGGHLLLVKSAPPPHADIERLASNGWVDEWFPTAARGLTRVEWAAPA